MSKRITKTALADKRATYFWNGYNFLWLGHDGKNGNDFVIGKTVFELYMTKIAPTWHKNDH
jgi:hypothetical protein